MGLAVLHPGLSTTVQDEGRAGYREWGVPVGGVFDRGAAALANALVGNSTASAVLEFTLFGGQYEARLPLALALAGAVLDARIVHRDRTTRTLTIPSSFPLQVGEILQLGGVRANLGGRSYLAVRGGWQTPLVLGSRSSETRLQAGDLLPAKAGAIPFRHLSESGEDHDLPVRILDGPDCPDPGIWEGMVFRVGRECDRMGLHLEGPPLKVIAAPDRLSMPVAPGTVQVAGGHLLVLGVACGTMGGYPHLAQIISVDLDRIAQYKPGALLRFQRITLNEARRLDREDRARQRDFLDRVRTSASDPGLP